MAIQQQPSAARSRQAMAASTAAIVSGIVITRLVLPAGAAVDIFTAAAVGVGLALGIGTAMEARAGLRALIRVDILILWVLYGLTFLEFLFPQSGVNDLLSPIAAASGTDAVLLGFAGLAVGRHLVPKPSGCRDLLSISELPPSSVFFLFLAATLLGYLHMFLAVDFDLIEVVRQISLPRFSQPWSRGKYGDAYSLLYEFGALIYLLPLIAGLIYARSSEYSIIKKLLVSVVIIFTFYYGFASGTRNIFFTYVITLVASYLLTKSNVNFRQIVTLSIPTLIFLMLATIYMLEIRTTGFDNFSMAEQKNTTFFVDMNIVNISRLSEVFPESFDFLGLEIPFNALIRPIPRFLWAGKPEGLSVTIESALGSSSAMTLSCTFVGEAYMAGGLFGVLLISLFFGAAAEMWNRVRGVDNSQFSQLLYVSGFLSAALGMRSMLSMVPLILPSIALWIYGRLFLIRLSVHNI